MWHTLEDHPEVLYGSALALGIVILLTPAVGGMARLLGVIDRPGARRLNRRAVPRLDLHGRFRRAAARLHARSARDPGPLEDGCGRDPSLPAARTGGADQRYLLRGREAAQVT